MALDYAALAGALILLGTPPNALAQADGDHASRFAGTWSAARPDAEGVIVNVPRATCEMPIVIEVIAPNRISYSSAGGGLAEFEIDEFNGRNPWFTDTGSMVAEWTAEGIFLLAETNAMGMADWANAFEYRNCP